MQYKSIKNKIKRNALFHIPLYTYRKKAKTISPKSRIISLIKKLVKEAIGSRVSFILGSTVFLNRNSVNVILFSSLSIPLISAESDSSS